MDYHGMEYATCAAFLLDEEDDAAQLARELGLEMLPIKGWDSTIVQHKFIPDLWGESLDQLPYSSSVIESFKKFKKEMLAIDLKTRIRTRQHAVQQFPRRLPSRTAGVVGLLWAVQLGSTRG